MANITAVIEGFCTHSLEPDVVFTTAKVRRSDVVVLIKTMMYSNAAFCNRSARLLIVKYLCNYR